MEKLPKYATITIDQSAFGKIAFKLLKDALKKHGVSKTSIDIFQGLAVQYYGMNKKVEEGETRYALTLADTQKIESILSKADKASNAKLFVEDKFSKNNVTEASYAHQSIKDVTAYYMGNIEESLAGANFVVDLGAKNIISGVEADMAANYLEDYVQHLKLSFAILSKKFAEAKEVIDSMDTSVRERVPSDVMNYVLEQTGDSRRVEADTAH